LYPATKTAIVVKTNDWAELFNVFEILSDPAAQATNEIAGKEIDGVQTRGFRVPTTTDGDLAVYVHPTTMLPVSIEFASPAGESIVIDKFVFNLQLDEAIFSSTPPVGYSVLTKDLTAHGDAAAELGRGRTKRWTNSEGRSNACERTSGVSRARPNRLNRP
jgi:hypothetical protein